MKAAAATLLAVTLFGASIGHVNAAGLRCGNALVSQGDSIVGVVEKCGDPIREARLVNSYGKQIGTVMYFDPGYGKNTRRVTFRGGRVASIEQVR